MGRAPQAAQAELKRMLLRLSLLDGRAFVTPGQTRLLQVVAVRDAAGLIAAGAEPTNADLSRCLELRRAPLELSTRWLAAAQRDLKILRSNPTLLRSIEESPRTFRRYGTIDTAWLDDRQRRIDELGRAAPPTRFGLVAAIKGNEVAARLDQWFSRSEDAGTRRRADLRQRLAVLIATMKGQPRQAALLDATIAGLRDAARRPGRASARNVRRLVVRFLAWPGMAHDDFAAEAEDTVQAIGEQYIASLPSTRTPEALSRLERALTLLGLTCEVEDEGSLTQHEVGLVLRKLSGTSTPVLTIRALLGVLALDLNQFHLRAALGALGAGLPIDTVTALAKADLLSRIHEFKDDAKALQLWARWMVEVAQALPNRKVELPTELFLGRGATTELRAFAEVLLNRGDEPPTALLDAFDTMLAISKRSPQTLGTIRARLAQTTSGLGRRHAAEFTTWLGDDALIDRHFTLKALLGEPLEISRTLRRDFAARERLSGELLHLRGRTSLTAAQRKRVDLLAQRLDDERLAGPEWTRRELGERNIELERRALELLFDDSLRESLRAGWGLTLAKGPLSAAWRDALRFMLVTRHNVSVLERLLTHAAREPGTAIARKLPKNVEWIEKASAHFDVEAWLAARSETVTISGRQYVLSTEHDPLEALRMGIPFDTCLSLTDGSNAGAAVLNAVEANKRVLYLRLNGTIVARKLVAVSSSWSLLGYRTYSALDGSVFDQVDAAFDRLCRAIAADAKLPLGNAGAPDKLHGGFWYDDGLVAFAGAPSSSISLFCASLGRPEFASRGLAQAARAWAARETNDVEGALAVLSRWSYDGETRNLADWAIERLGEAESVKRARDLPLLADALLDRAARKGTRQLLAMFERVRVSWRTWEQTAALLDRFPARGLARQLVHAARAGCGKTGRFDDHDIEHGTIWLLPYWLERESVATTFEVIEQVEPVWRYVIENAEDCASCVDGAIDRLEQVMVDQYGREPSPRVIIEALESSRSRHVLRLALAVAARFPFPRGRSDQPPDVCGFTLFEGAPIGCPAALRALKALPERMPAFAKQPDLVAAVLRQGGTFGACDAPPFEALGDLQLHAAPRLEDWDDTPVHRPGPWALAYHRRHQTRWRAQLRQAKATDWDATVWRAVLGDTRETARRTVDVRSPQAPSLRRTQLEAAQWLARRQLEGVFDGLHELPAECADAFVIVGVIRDLRLAIENADTPRALELVQSLDGTPLPHWRDWRAMTEQALDQKLPNPIVTALAARWIPACTWSAPELEPRLIRRLAEVSAVRPLIVTTLARVDPSRLVPLFAQLEALGITPALDTLLDEWLREWVRQDADRLSDGALFGLPNLVARLSRLAFETPGGALQLFLRRPSFREASEMIEQLLTRFEPAVLRELVLRESTDADDLACRRAWLLAATS